jgi:two-component system chemotaxis response regulator CheB
MAFAGPIVVLGASAGGVQSLQSVAAMLPPDFPGAVFVVLHLSPSQPSALPDILSRSGPLPAVHPTNGEEIQKGRIYVAPPDHHLLIDRGFIAVAKGPKENRFRPSIDALFRSAAYSYGPQVIGVVLSGALDDGTSGLWNIKRMGGITIVQEPGEASCDSMPLSAMAQVQVDYRTPASEIGALIGRLGSQTRLNEQERDPLLEKRLSMELEIAREGGAFQKGIMDDGRFTPYTCPECGGALVELSEDQMTRYRCHTGHGYSDSALLEGVMDATGEMLWKTMRSLEEGVMRLKHMGARIKATGARVRAEAYFAKVRELEERSKSLHDAVLRHETLSADTLTKGGT